MAKLADQLVETAREHDDEPRWATSGVAEGVRDTGWHQDGRAGLGNQLPVAEPEPQGAGDHVPCLVVVVMHVERRYLVRILTRRAVGKDERRARRDLERRRAGRNDHKWFCVIHRPRTLRVTSTAPSGT